MTDPVRCNDCGGFVGQSSCVCELQEKVWTAIQEKLEVTEEELDNMVRDGRFYLTSMGRVYEGDHQEEAIVIPLTMLEVEDDENH